MTTAGSSSPLLPPALSGRDISPFLWRSGAILGWSLHWRLPVCLLTITRIAFTGMFTGAFGAHGLKRRAGITPDDLNAWGTASTYAVCGLSVGSSGD